MLASQARDTSSILVSRTGRLVSRADVAQWQSNRFVSDRLSVQVRPSAHENVRCAIMCAMKRFSMIAYTPRRSRQTAFDILELKKFAELYKKDINYFIK